MMVFRKLVCFFKGHTPRTFFDARTGDICTACARCFRPMAEPNVMYPQDLPELNGPKLGEAAGDVKCSDCGHEWHSYHHLAAPIRCSDCREKRERLEREAKAKAEQESAT